MNTSPNKSKIQFLNKKQASKFFAKLVYFNLGINIKEFYKRYKDGEYKNICCSNSKLIKILMMIPKDINDKSSNKLR